MTSKSMKFIKKLTVTILFLFSTNLYSQTYLNNEFIYFLDEPAGFESVETGDERSSVLESTFLPVTIISKIIDNTKFNNETEICKTNLAKLGAEYYTDTYKWNGKDSVIANFNMTLDQKYTGWAVCTPSKDDKYYILILAYAPSENSDVYEKVMLSALNGLCVDWDFYCTPGIVATYAYPQEDEVDLLIDIDDNQIKTKMYLSDLDASKFVVDLEYNVLRLYAKRADVQVAWERYYRNIYRDNFGRVCTAVEDIVKELYPIAEKENFSNPDLVLAQKLLSWIQTFEYKRAANTSDSDFTTLPAVLYGEGNDCDSRSMLMCAFLRVMGKDAVLLISPEFSHAMVAGELNGFGQKYKIPGTELEFLMGETTAKVNWGTIAKDFADRSKWFPVIIP